MSQGGGLLFDLSKRAMATGNTAELDEAIRSKIRPYLYNGGAGKWIHCAHLACLRNRDRPKSKQFDEIKVKFNKMSQLRRSSTKLEASLGRFNYFFNLVWTLTFSFHSILFLIRLSAKVLLTSSLRGASCWKV